MGPHTGIYAGHVCFRLTICPLLRQRGWVGCQRGSHPGGTGILSFPVF